MRKFLFICSLGLLLAGCGDPCNGHIETTVLYFQEAPSHQGQLVYANVLNKPDLGIKHTLMREDKEFGTFGNVVIIEDPQMKFKGRRTVCFDKFTVHKIPIDSLSNDGIVPRILITQ